MKIKKTYLIVIINIINEFAIKIKNDLTKNSNYFNYCQNHFQN